MKFIRRLFNRFFGSKSKVWRTDIVVGPSDNIKLTDILASGFDYPMKLAEESATKANIDYALQRLDEQEGPDTEVFIYFSGHGGPINDQAPLDEADSTDELLGIYDTNDTPQFVDHILDKQDRNDKTSENADRDGAEFGGENDNETIFPT